MLRPWIENLARDTAVALEHTKQHAEDGKKAVEAFDRLKRELHAAVDELNRLFPQRFSVRELPEGLLVDSHSGTGHFTSARFFWNDNEWMLHTQPSANFAIMSPKDQHTFTYDVHSNSFVENRESVSDDEVVRRALESFLASNLGIRK